MAKLLFDFLRTADSVGDFMTEQFAKSPTRSVERDFERANLHSQLLPQQGVVSRFGLFGEERAQSEKKSGPASLLVLLAKLLENTIDEHRSPAPLKGCIRRD